MASVVREPRSVPCEQRLLLVALTDAIAAAAAAGSDFAGVVDALLRLKATTARIVVTQVEAGR